ncbi:MAG: hypothetical protein J6333_09530, partial [Planctomycetes bacterium]|nr:hypothetical protein [Planctomycetota bacterium]
DLNLFSLASYYAIDVRKINEFSDLPGTPASGIAFTDASDKPYVSVFERHVNPPIKEEFRKAQQKAIAQELQKIEAMLTPYTPEKIAELRQKFTQAWEAEKATDPPNYNRVVRGKTEYVWRNVENSFWALPTNYRLPEYQENPIAPYNLEALIALRDFLEANGCQFLISPVPGFQEIAARVINPEFRTLPDFQTAYMARQLLKHGIETFYPSQTLIDNFNRYPWAFFFPHNPHPSDTTQEVMTDIVAKRIAYRYHFPETIDHTLFSIKLSPHVYGEDNKQYWFPSNCNVGMNTPNTPFRCRQILCDGKAPVSDMGSPILVIGNSYMQTPMLKPDSFPSLLSSKLNIDIQQFRVSGTMGPTTTITQQLFSSPETTLLNKKLLILAVSTWHLCTPSAFNNIREMDGLAKCMSGKTLISAFPLKPNIYANNTKINTFYISSLPTAPNFFEIPKTGTITLADAAIANIDSHKPAIVVIPTALDSRQSAKYVVNDKNVSITTCSRRYPHLNAFCELPAGTDRLKVELVGEPGTILSIRSIQVYQ